MEEKKLYSIILHKLYEGLKTENHEKFQNNRLEERKFAIGDLYPDIILTKKDSKEVDFILEIVVPTYLKKETLLKKWKPLSEVGPTFYLVVPKEKHKIVEKWCSEEKLKVRFGTYEFENDQVELKFY